MKELISKLVDQAGMDEKTAKKAIGIVKDFLEDKLPSPVDKQVSKILSGMDSSQVKDVMDKAKGLFGK